jgi:membrane protein
MSHILLSLRRLRPIDFGVFVVRRMLELKMTQAAASLTYTSLLAIVPFFAVALTVLSAFPFFSKLRERFQTMIFGALVPEYAEKVQSVLHSFVNNVGNLTAPGILALVVIAILMLNTIETSFNSLWRVRRKRTLRYQLLVYWMILTLGPVMLAVGLTLWRWLNRFIAGTAGQNVIAPFFQSATSFILLAAFLSLLYRFVPNRSVKNSHAIAGGIIATILIEILRQGFSWYVGKISNYQLVYGAFASLPVFLLWLYCLWFIVLAGAVIAASLPFWRANAWRRASDKRLHFQYAVKILLLLFTAQCKGLSMTFSQLHRRLDVADEQLDEILATLERNGFAQIIKSNRYDAWVLKRSADHLTLAEVMRVFLDDQMLESSRPIDAELQERLAPLFHSLDVNLSTFAYKIEYEAEQKN